MKIQKITDASFAPYGRVLKGYDFGELLERMKDTPLPADGVIYVQSQDDLEKTAVAKELSLRGFGGMEIEVGFCNGNSHKLNAIEYHRSSEINLAADDLILILGKQQDIEHGDTYDTSKMEAFLLPGGTAVELYATTLHYAPCSAGGHGFRCVIVLPRGTNSTLEEKPTPEGEGKLLAAENKWLIAHEDAGIPGAHCGLTGENLKV